MSVSAPSWPYGYSPTWMAYPLNGHYWGALPGYSAPFYPNYTNQNPPQLPNRSQRPFAPPQDSMNYGNIMSALNHLLAPPSLEDIHAHEHPHSEESQEKGMLSRFEHLAEFAGLIMMALLLRKMPRPHVSEFRMFSSNWRDWARITLGVMAVGKLNKVFDWKPAPWMGALETALVITPLALGPQGIRQLVVVAPLVMGTVEATNQLNKRLGESLENRYHIPKALTRLVISLAMAIGGIKLYPTLFKHATQWGLLGKKAQIALKNATRHGSEQLMAGASVILCPRACCSSLVCMTDIGELIGSLGWFQSYQKPGAKKAS